jgi:DNA-binding response OmpR family regulator
MWRKLQAWPCDLVVLDLRLPGGEDGLILAQKLREESEVAIIMLTGRSDSIDKVVGLELGADDYVTKPFEPRELLARIRSVLRRAKVKGEHAGGPGGDEDIVEFSGWVLNLTRRSLTDESGRAVELTTYEFELLAILARRPGRPLSRDQILALVANRQWGPDDRSIDVLIGKLRHKLHDNPRAPRLIKTVRGIGYLFTPLG